MNTFRPLKVLLALLALTIVVLSLYGSHKITEVLYGEELTKMEVWSEAMRSLTEADEHTDLNLVLKVINSNTTIPVVVYDSGGTLLASRNLSLDTTTTSATTPQRIRTTGRSMRIPLTASHTTNHSTPTTADYIEVYYQESLLLRYLTIFPYVQLAFVALFLLIALLALLVSKRAEQNRVWVGLSRETAHQLGTPISSLMAWSQVLRELYPDEPLFSEMDHDINRLQLVADRFSKIGSQPRLTPVDVSADLRHFLAYFSSRTSRHVTLTTHIPKGPIFVLLNAPLFDWVIENLCKNAVDAMEGHGHIQVTLIDQPQSVILHLSDTGKGLPHRLFKRIFQPGFTTKKRGWGLGLSLAHRIINDYHHGNIYVKESELGKGTTFAIVLRK